MLYLNLKGGNTEIHKTEHPDEIISLLVCSQPILPNKLETITKRQAFSLAFSFTAESSGVRYLTKTVTQIYRINIR